MLRIVSIKLLTEVGKLTSEKGYKIENIDATIIAQKPKMAPHIPLNERKYSFCIKR